MQGEDRFVFYDDLVVHNHVWPEHHLEVDSIIVHRERRLFTDRVPPLLELIHQTRLIHRLQQSRPELSMHGMRRVDQVGGQLFQCGIDAHEGQQ